MAIFKREKLPQGYTLTYHRLLSFSANLPDVHVTLAGYVNEDIRNREKAREEKQAELIALEKKINDLRTDSLGEPEDNEVELAELGDQYNKLSIEVQALGNEQLYVKTVDYDVKIEGEATREAIYKALLALPNFDSAVDRKSVV